MSTSGNDPDDESDVSRLAYEIWESEGKPEGRDHEHWERAKELVAAGAVPGDVAGGRAPRPVQPGFEDAPPGMVPDMKDRPEEDLEEDAGGRFAKQLSDLPEEPDDAPRGPSRDTEFAFRSAGESLPPGYE
jgi:hypothetical protein